MAYCHRLGRDRAPKNEAFKNGALKNAALNRVPFKTGFLILVPVN